MKRCMICLDMHILYASNHRLPTEKAHGQQIAQVAQSMVDLNHTVTIIAPLRTNPITVNFSDYYNVSDSINIVYIRVYDFIKSRLFPSVFGLFALNCVLKKRFKKYICKHSESIDVIYTRTPELLPALLNVKKPIILELHSVPKFRIKRFVRLYNRCAAVSCLTSGMRDYLLQLGVSKQVLIVQPDAIPQSWLDENISESSTVRAKYNIPQDAYVIGYTGQLTTIGMSKGVDILLQAFAQFSATVPNALLVIVGGTSKQFNELLASVQFVDTKYIMHIPHQPHSTIRALQQASDVLVYPAPKSNHVYFQRDTSPLKLFEYLAAKKPIVCAKIPPVLDVVSSDSVFFCEPGNVNSMCNAFHTVRQEPEVAKRKTMLGLNIVEDFTWKKRAKRIMDFVNK